MFLLVRSQPKWSKSVGYNGQILSLWFRFVEEDLFFNPIQV